MKAARPPRCYGVSWLPVSASELILSSGSKTFSPASPIIPLPGLPSFYRTTGCPPRLDPKIRTAQDRVRRWRVRVILGRLQVRVIEQVEKVRAQREVSALTPDGEALQSREIVIHQARSEILV